MYCPKCKIDTGNEDFCENCGTETVDKLDDNSVEKSSESKKEFKIEKPSIKKNNIKKYIKLGGAAIIIIALVIGYSSMKNAYSPDKVASKYVGNLTEGNTEEAFKMLDIEEGDFINQDSYDEFIKSMEIEGKESVINEVEYDDFISEFLGAEELNSEVMPRDMKYYEVKIEPNSYNLELIKKGKKLGAFDNWLISTEGFKTELNIKAPKGTKIFIDDKEIVAENNNSGMDNVNVYYKPEYKTFNIAPVFPIEYEVIAKLEGAKDIKQVVSPENPMNEIKFEATKELEDKLISITEEFLNLHYSDSDESEFKDIVSKDFFEANRMSNYIDFVSRELKELSIESTSIDDVEHISLVTNVNYDFEEETFESFFTDELIIEKGNADEKLEFLFQKNNDKWVVVDVQQAY